MPDARSFLPLSPQQFHILLALVDQPRHGYGIILDVADRTGGEMRMGTGTLYTGIARLLALALVADTHREHDRRRYYKITPLGRAVLIEEAARLEALVRLARDGGVLPARSRS
jgi:DNA-binding PadR family transcriptional regulator